MEIIYKKLCDIKGYEKNPRKNDESVNYVMESIKEFGFKVPIIVDKDGIIVCGHTRFKAAKKLNIDSVPCIIADDLSEEQINAFRLADNKVSEFSKWDFKLLDDEIDSILKIDMSKFGFNMDEKEEEVEPELEFTEVLGEEHNYIVLYFDNEVDWIQAQSVFDIKPKKNLSTRKDEKISEKMQRVSLGRVLNGAKALEEMRKYYEN